jgi:hypothetical protein
MPKDASLGQILDDLTSLGDPMKKRVLFLTLAAGLLVWGSGALEARAGIIPLPTTLDNLTGANSGNSVVTGLEPDTFSNFTFSSSVLMGSPPVLTPAGVTVSAFGPVGLESGITFSGAFTAPPGTTVDYSISYIVTAPAGFLINDAMLSASMNGGNGAVVITELLTDKGTGKTLPPLGISTSGGTTSQEVFFPGVHQILVQKDILLVGGANGTGSVASIINQGFSSTNSIPEPTSIALLGIGLTGFLAFRRLFRRTSFA